MAATSANPEITSKEIPAKIDERFYAESTDNPWGPAATEKLTATLIHLVPSGSRFGDVDCPAARAASAGAGPVTQRRPDRLRRIDRPRAALGGRRKSNQDWHVKACEAPPEGRGYLCSSFPFWRRRERHRQKGSLECVVTRALATAAPTPWKNAAMS